MIDYNYMNSRFEKWMKQLEQPGVPQEVLDQTLEELHKSFAFLSQEDQKFANLFYMMYRPEMYHCVLDIHCRITLSCIRITRKRNRSVGFVGISDARKK